MASATKKLQPKRGKKQPLGQTSVHEELFTKIKEVIDERIRPFINMDGGEIHVLELTPENVLKVSLTGACHGCAASSMTLNYGIQNLLFEVFPEEDIQVLLVQD